MSAGTRISRMSFLVAFSGAFRRMPVVLRNRPRPQTPPSYPLQDMLLKICRINSRDGRFESLPWHPDVLTYFSSAVLKIVVEAVPRNRQYPLLRQHFKVALFNYLVISLDALRFMPSQEIVPAGPGRLRALRATAPCHRRSPLILSQCVGLA
jgi:hypothetical protein